MKATGNLLAVLSSFPNTHTACAIELDTIQVITQFLIAIKELTWNKLATPIDFTRF